MPGLEIVLWALALASGVWGIAAKDWRASILALVVAVVAFVMLISHAWR